MSGCAFGTGSHLYHAPNQGSKLIPLSPRLPRLSLQIVYYQLHIYISISYIFISGMFILAHAIYNIYIYIYIYIYNIPILRTPTGIVVFEFR